MNDVDDVNQSRQFFPLPVYLNYKSIIDLSAVMDDGFSEFEEISSRYTNQDTTSDKSAGGLGVSAKAFSIVNIGGEAKKEKTGSSTQEGMQEHAKRKVQTNTSLFTKLRGGLYDRGLVANHYNGVKSGGFIELRGTFFKPSLAAAIDAMIATIEVGAQIEGSIEGQNGYETTRERARKVKQKIPPEVLVIIDMLDASGSIDLIFKTAASNILVVSFDKEILQGKNIDDILAGEYILFGKVASIIPKDKTWNSLQKTPLGIFHESVTEKLTEAFTNPNSQKMRETIKMPELVSVSLPGPVLLVQPIAVYS